MKKYKPYESVFMESFIQDLKKSIQELYNILSQNNINFTIIGGAARNEYGVKKITEDVDILVDAKDKEKMKKLPIGYIKELSKGTTRVFSLHEPKTKVEVIYTGEISGDGIHGLVYVDPKKVSERHNGIPFLTLKNLVMYKLSAARHKDYADVQELIKVNKLKRNYADKFRVDLKNKYIELYDETKNERDI
jgi:predicted nucleotidyltransferase